MEQTATKAAQGGAVGQLTRAISRVAGDRILVTVTATKPDKSRVSIHEVFDSEGQSIGNDGQPTGRPGLKFAAAGGQQPQLDVKAYTTALTSKNEAEAGRLIKTYREQLEAFNASGGTTESERIGNAVYSYLQANHGVSAQDGDHLILKPEQVVVMAPTRAGQNEPGVWLLQLAPTWGQR